VAACARVIFKGKVQGVLFRANTRKIARAEGVRGWVRNLQDGTVEAVFEGDKGAVERVISWCRTSQPHARVSKTDIAWEEARGEGEFAIRYD